MGGGADEATPGLDMGRTGRGGRPGDASARRRRLLPPKMPQRRASKPTEAGSEEGSYSRLIDFAYHSTLGSRVIKKKKTRRRESEKAAPAPVPGRDGTRASSGAQLLKDMGGGRPGDASARRRRLLFSREKTALARPLLPPPAPGFPGGNVATFVPHKASKLIVSRQVDFG